jgi:flagellar basal body rod protein FlgC
MINKKCEVCGKEFKTYLSKLKLGRGKYCSKECSFKITNKKLDENGKKTRFKKGHKSTYVYVPGEKGIRIRIDRPHNYQGYTYSLPRKGGKKYILIHLPEHPNATKKGYVREHRLEMELEIGRFLTADEVVHHIDGDSENNKIDNLQLMTIKEHDSLKS